MRTREIAWLRSSARSLLYRVLHPLCVVGAFIVAVLPTYPTQTSVGVTTSGLYVLNALPRTTHKLVVIACHTTAQLGRKYAVMQVRTHVTYIIRSAVHILQPM